MRGSCRCSSTPEQRPQFTKLLKVLEEVHSEEEEEEEEGGDDDDVRIDRSSRTLAPNNRCPVTQVEVSCSVSRPCLCTDSQGSSMSRRIDPANDCMQVFDQSIILLHPLCRQEPASSTFCAYISSCAIAWLHPLSDDAYECSSSTTLESPGVRISAYPCAPRRVTFGQNDERPDTVRSEMTPRLNA